jgi:SAM-dependent methyltransferase
MRDKTARFERVGTHAEEHTYGEVWAPHYDEIYSTADADAIDLLAGFAGDPPRVLELAIGTGRLALPLAERGVDVIGVDISPEMIARLRTKPGGDRIEIVVGDMVEVPVDGTFPLIFLAFNTLFALQSQERQLRCFGNVADHLEPGGRFVIDCFVPDMKRFDSNNTRMGVTSIDSVDEHSYELSVHDPVHQRIVTHQVRRRADGTSTILPVTARYAWPPELDLMAQLAGLELEERWGWYDRRPFTAVSGQHVSVYRKPA